MSYFCQMEIPNKSLCEKRVTKHEKSLWNCAKGRELSIELRRDMTKLIGTSLEVALSEKDWYNKDIDTCDIYMNLWHMRNTFIAMLSTVLHESFFPFCYSPSLPLPLCVADSSDRIIIDFAYLFFLPSPLSSFPRFFVSATSSGKNCVSSGTFSRIFCRVYPHKRHLVL